MANQEKTVDGKKDSSLVTKAFVEGEVRNNEDHGNGPALPFSKYTNLTSNSAKE